MGICLNPGRLDFSRHPGLNNLAEEWTQLYETQGEDAAQDPLQQRKRQYHIDVQVLNESGEPVVRGTFPRRRRLRGPAERQQGRPPAWRRLTAEYTSETGDTYLLIYRIPHLGVGCLAPVTSLLWPLSATPAIALVVLTLFSLLVTLSITCPLAALRGAVHDLGQATYQQKQPGATGQPPR